MVSKFSLVIVFLAFVAAGALVSTPLANAQCQLGLDVTYAPVQQLSLADIDFEHFESRNLLFTVTIANPPGSAARAQLVGELNVVLDDGSYTGTAVDFLTEPFPVPAEGKQLTNLDLGFNAEIKMESLNFREGAKERVQDVALSTGKFPAGKYTLRITLQQLDCSAGPVDVGTKDIEFDLTNPSRVELRSPRDGEQTSEFPLFEFFSDGNPVTLTVAEMSQGQSREDAIERQPAMLETELSGQNTFLYAGGRSLERGKSYVWQVKTSTFTSGGGAATVASPVGMFTVAETPGQEEATTEDAILRQLEELFGNRYPSLFKSIRDGQLTLSGTFTLNQSSLTEAQLLDLISQLREMSDAVDLTLE